jgi:hypothetical protein
MIAEYTSETPNLNPTVTYITQDDYDNRRVMTNVNGEVTQRRDYMPFGEELQAGFGNRTEASLGYNSNQLRHGFAGHKKMLKRALTISVNDIIRLRLGGSQAPIR